MVQLIEFDNSKEYSNMLLWLMFCDYLRIQTNSWFNYYSLVYPKEYSNMLLSLIFFDYLRIQTNSGLIDTV
jgi:hypothetical protein